MLRVFRLVVPVLIAGALFSACTPGADKLLVRQDGTWRIDQYDLYELADGDTTFAFELSNIGTITFNEDGSGSQIVNVLGQTDSVAFDWTYDEAQTRITIAYDSTTEVFDVEESLKDSQVFRRDETETRLYPFSGDSVVYRSIAAMLLSRSE
ncbi:MAG: hypothetical protein OHK0039_28510 [Bacteroidia bacterium]